MSGHSKWHNIKRKKGAEDVRRGKLFTKLGRMISIAAQHGADPEANFTLRLAVDKARAERVPKENIERAIARGAGTSEEGALSEALYEGFGPGGIAVLVEATTDSKNRTSAEVKKTLTDHGGSLGSPNSVLWMFEQKGVVVVPPKSITDALELRLIDAGAEDIVREGEDSVVVTTTPQNLQAIKAVLEEAKITIEDASLAWIPKETMRPEPAAEERVRALLDALDALDDVHNVTSNAELYSQEHENMKT